MIHDLFFVNSLWSKKIWELTDLWIDPPWNRTTTFCMIERKENIWRDLTEQRVKSDFFMIRLLLTTVSALASKSLLSWRISGYKEKIFEANLFRQISETFTIQVTNLIQQNYCKSFKEWIKTSGTHVSNHSCKKKYL